MDSILKGLVSDLFPVLNKGDTTKVAVILSQIFDTVIQHFNVTMKDLLGQIFNNKDVGINFIHMLLPLPAESDYTKVKSLAQLYFSKKICFRSFETDMMNLTIDEHLLQAKESMMATIRECSVKLLCNHVDVWGVPPSLVHLHPLYDADQRACNSRDLSQLKGITIHDIYNTIVRDLYLNITDIKWLLYESEYISYQEVVDDLFIKENHPPFQEIVTAIETNNGMLEYDSFLVLNVVKYGLVFLENYNRHLLPITYKSLFKKSVDPTSDRETSDGRESYETSLENIIPSDIAVSLKSLGEDLWVSYLNDAVSKLKTTWYGHQKNVIYFNPFNDSGVRVPITRKLIYLFAKNFSHDSIKSWNLVSRFSKNHPNVLKFLQKRIFDNSEMYRWFNPTKYITSKTNFENTVSLDDRVSVLTIIREHIIKIVYQNIACKGCLSMLSFGKSPESIDSYSSYNFISNGPERDLPIFNSDDNRNWRRRATVHWSSQLSLFHRILNNRIMYVSAATGAGKTTQIPKLFLYASSALQYKNNAKVMCTQPRIKPTVDNAEFVARELGYPLSDGNYGIQYTYSAATHTPEMFYSRYFLRFSTDGMLLSTIQSQPFLLQTVESFKETILSGATLWDTVIIDESHEHNMNMDLIISCMKPILQINPFISLVIMSATMNSDEERYRRFFGSIGDISYADRRLHIGRSTNYPIQDFYLPEEPDTFEKAEKLGADKVLELAASVSGDILFFTIGESNIREQTNYLNSKLPPDWIAIPFYSQLPPSFRDRIKTPVSHLIRSIPFDRTKLFSVLDEHKDKWQDAKSASVPSPYKKCVIIATNVAEASITIDSLRFVVDTGYEKTNMYSPELGGTRLVVEKISESSRIQRRGRVGRRAPGKCYFIYARDGRKSILQKYGITSGDVFSVMTLLFTSWKSYLETFDWKLQITETYKTFGYTTLPTNLETMYNNLDVIDARGDFYIIHPDEPLLFRDPVTWRPTTSFKTWRSYYVSQVMNSIPTIHIALTNKFFLNKLISFMNALKRPEITVYHAISMQVGWSLGVLDYVVEYIVKKEISKEPAIISTRKAALSQKTREMISLVTEAFHATKFNRLVTLVSHLSTLDAIQYALYYSHPLSLANYSNNTWVNSFSNCELQLPSKYNIYALGYYSINENRPNDLLPLNNICFHHISNGYKRLGTLRMAFHT